MPMYEFACRACGRQFEAFVTASRTPVCPDCASTELDKLVSSFATASAGGSQTSRASSRFT